MKRTLTFILLLFVTGCMGITEPEPFIPTAIPTETATTTLRPTETNTITQTLSPTPMPTPTALSATQIIGATLTPLPITNTPTRMAGAPEIEYFVTSSVNLAPGDNATLLWAMRGANAGTIYRLDDEGERQQFWEVDERGRLVVATRETDQDRVRFALVVGEGEEEIEEILSIPLSGCVEPWFFGPAPPACPTGPAGFTQAAEQAFERGRMVWLEAEGKIYVLFDDAQQPAWEAFDDTFVAGETLESAPEFDNPPNESLTQPVRGFGLIWRENEPIRARLGWAIAPEEAFDGAVQSALGDEGVTRYMRGAEGTIFALAPEGQGWDILTPDAADESGDGS